jgi:serine phosphatase RsbU (regulator of sigma subunit)
LRAICKTQVCDSPPKLLEQVFAAVERFTHGRAQHDDMAAAVFHYGRD